MDSAAPPVRIFLRPIGSPLTLALSGLAVASFVQSGLDLSWIAKDQARDVGLILLAVPFLLQIVACVLAYLARDGAAGAATGLLAGTWLALGLIQVTAGTDRISGAMGLLMLMAGGTLLMSSLAVAAAKPLPGLVFGLTAVHFMVAGVYELSTAGNWQDAAGIIGLVVAGLAAYSVLAFELEGERHRPVLPTLRIGRGRAALMGDPATQIDGVTGEPGVRQMT